MVSCWGHTGPEDSKTVNHPFPRSSVRALDVHGVLFWLIIAITALIRIFHFFMNYFKECLELFLKTT